ncbi:MAG: hypothetical protein NT157_02560 [Candidatus Micrarchaeota archaeon]|nr:hypothetical protein [Candidatus Micrarchaeota archaeon]
MYELIDAVEELRSAFRKESVGRLRDVSRRCADELGVGEEVDMLPLSITAYVLSKIIQKSRYWDKGTRTRLAKSVGGGLDRCAELLHGGKHEEFRMEIGRVMRDTIEVDDRKNRYVTGLLAKAKLKIAGRLYAQGFSLSRVSELTGADKREVMEYVGKTLMSDLVGKTKTVNERLEHVRRLF